MPSFNLRLVSDLSPSPSPTASAPPSDNSPAYKGPASPPPATRSRRPLSPSSLRDVDVTRVPDMPPRRYPAPPTGHDLMAMFPAVPPDNSSEMRPGPTSAYFQCQERAFFARAGKEIIRVRVDVDLQPGSTDPDPKAPAQARPWARQPCAQASSSTNSPAPAPSPALYAAPPQPTHARGPSASMSASVPATPVFPPAPHPHAHPHAHAHPPHHVSSVGRRTPDPAAGDSPFTPGGDTDDPNEAWRRPIPYNERRRAGKYTRRAVVRN
ncbi:hypothetical protein C8R43DRAFT_1193472 [Mycena crocata]|nr:hypothetical protein C8R43DRAFT_1193472 [Mycena crocata]